MFKMKRLTWVIGCTFALTGCASFYKDKHASLAGIEIKPVMSIKHASDNPRVMYLLGRYYQGKVNYQRAITAYEKALVAKPDYAEVYNGLGVIYSIQGQHELALQHFTKAIEISPAETYLHNNLGYAYLMQGKEREAAKALEQALLLDSDNKRAQHNLAIAYERISLNRVVASIQSTSTNILSTEIPSAVNISAKAEPIQIKTNDIDLKNDESETQLTQTSPRIIENQITRSTELPPVPLEQISAIDEDIKLLNFWDTRIEISNGNGITGMARQVSAFFQQQGLAKAHLTNHQTYTQFQTKIYYRSGNYQQALQINKMLPKPVQLLESNELRNDVQIKILLGKDYSRKITDFNQNNLVQMSQNSEKLVIN